MLVEGIVPHANVVLLQLRSGVSMTPLFAFPYEHELRGTFLSASVAISMQEEDIERSSRDARHLRCGRSQAHAT